MGHRKSLPLVTFIKALLDFLWGRFGDTLPHPWGRKRLGSSPGTRIPRLFRLLRISGVITMSPWNISTPSTNREKMSADGVRLIHLFTNFYCSIFRGPCSVRTSLRFSILAWIVNAKRFTCCPAIFSCCFKDCIKDRLCRLVCYGR